MKEKFLNATCIHPDYFLFQVLVSLGLEVEEDMGKETDSVVYIRDIQTTKVIGKITQTKGKMLIEKI